MRATEIPAGYSRSPPNLCVEALSPCDRWRLARHKLNEYLDCGVEVVWVLDPDARELHVFREEDSSRRLTGDDVIETPVLPGFQCSVSEFFAGLPAR